MIWGFDTNLSSLAESHSAIQNTAPWRLGRSRMPRLPLWVRVGLGALLLAPVLLHISVAGAQVDTAWARIYDGLSAGLVEGAIILSDTSGNVFAIGSELLDNTARSLLIIKYTPAGDFLWDIEYTPSGSGTYRAGDAALSESGNLYVAGEATGVDSTQDLLLLKVSNSGSIEWERILPVGERDIANRIALDGSGGVVIAGATNCLPQATGLAQASSPCEFRTIKYDTLGNLLWANSIQNYQNVGSGLFTSPSGDVYVLGTVYNPTIGESELVIQKYAVDGDSLWRVYHNGPQTETYARDLIVDPNGNVYATGVDFSFFGSETSADLLTAKYTSSGAPVWERIFEGDDADAVFAVNGYGSRISIDSDQNVHVLGNIYRDSSYLDIVTLKYSAVGDLLWSREFNGTGNEFDGDTGILLDSLDNVYFSGATESGAGAFWDYLLVSLDPDGNTRYTHVLDGPDGDRDVANSLALLPDRSVAVTGYVTYNGGAESDMMTVRYTPFCECNDQADFDGSGFLDAIDLNAQIDIVFFNGEDLQDPDCPNTRADFNNDGFPDAIDLNGLIEHLFFNGPNPCDPCDPVQASCVP